MDHYLDIRLRPDPEFLATQLMSALFAKLHRALVALPGQEIGISFPDVNEHRPRLGERLRLHGNATALDTLMTHPWIPGMHDYLQMGELLPIPMLVQYRHVSRVQAKSSPERLRRRQVRRQGLSEEEVRQRIPESAARTLNLPFVSLCSQSTGQSFHLFIRHGPLQAKPSEGSFSRYGLSNDATVPWF